MVVNVALWQSQGSQPMCPGPDVTAAKWDKYQHASLLHVRQVGQRRIVCVQDGRNTIEELDVVRALDDEQDSRLRGKRRGVCRLVRDGYVSSCKWVC